MKRVTLRFWLLFAAALVSGVLLHFLYDWLPCGLTALISPVRESIWEHLKVLFYPLVIFGLLPAGKRGWIPWVWSALLSCAMLLLFGWLYHIVIKGSALIVDLVLYAVLMYIGFRLPRLLWPLAEWPGVGAAGAMLALLLAVLLAVFSFAPPDNILFADLSGGIHTFLTIPV